jgi:hypothetical protein
VISFAPWRAHNKPAGPNFYAALSAYPSDTPVRGALFETLRKFYRTDQIAFTFISDELTA